MVGGHGIYATSGAPGIATNGARTLRTGLPLYTPNGAPFCPVLTGTLQTSITYLVHVHRMVDLL